MMHSSGLGFPYRYALPLLLVLVAATSTSLAGLTHQYTFNGSASDSVGTAHGTLQGGAALSLSGKASLDGINDYVSFSGAQLNLNSYVDATFEGWFTLDTAPAWQRLFDFGLTSGGLGGDYIFYTPSSGVGDNRVALSNSSPGGGNEDIVAGGSSLTTGRQYHVAVVVDDNSNGGSDTMSLYIDGAFVNSTPLTRTMSGLSNSLAFLGRSLYSSDAYFDGSINEFRIYNNALSPSDVMTSFQKGPDIPDVMAISVYTSSGQVAMSNVSAGSTFAIKHYQISSANGALDTGGWVSLSDRDLDTSGPGNGQSWDESGGSNSTGLAEYYLAGSSTLTPGKRLYLGRAFNPAVFGAGAIADLKFQFALNSGELVPGKVDYITEDADFNNDGDVDGDDFLIWQRHAGTTMGASNNMGDADGNGTVDAYDLRSWEALYGTSPSPLAQSSQAVPEPGTILLAMLPLMLLGELRCYVRRRRQLVCVASPPHCPAAGSVLSRVTRTSSVMLFALFFTGGLAGMAEAATYHVKRLTNDLHIPIYATTAPGDNDRIFVAQLGGVAADGSDGDPITKAEGRIVIYDRTTGLVDYNNPYLVISDTSLFEGVAIPEVGLFSLAFHPDFMTNGKFYVNVAVDHTGTPPTVDTRVSPFKTVLREYTVSDPTSNQADIISSRTILELNQPQFNHNGSWIGFNPFEVAEGKNYLYITQGDGGDQHDPANYGQDNTSWYASLMRIDIDGDDFPGDSLHNYAIPADNPFVGTSGADELFAYGLRNPWRASFDRQTGDLWIGDVGQGRREEIDFIPAGSPGGQNFGWRLREGSVATPTGGVGGPPPPGNVDPVYEYFHTGFGPTSEPDYEGLAVTGGYVYRGSIPEFQGRYFFADSSSGNVWSFDPNDPAGTVINMNDMLAPDEGSIISIVSFGEDENGELLMVDGSGELFQLVRNYPITLTINRDNGNRTMTLTNDSGVVQDIRGYSLQSAFGAIEASNLTPVTGHYDSPPGGNGLVDADDDWQITSTSGDHALFSEESLGDGGSLGIGQSVELSPGDAWIPSPNEDLRLFVTLGDGSEVEASVVFTGNGESAFPRSDLDFDGDVDENDWPLFIGSNLLNLSGMSLAQAYGHGDLDGDLDNDFDDFLLFEADFDEANGPGAFQEFLNSHVPEPNGLLLALLACLHASWFTKRSHFCIHR
jgi:glucose/arabinose dehydrogenase